MLFTIKNKTLGALIVFHLSPLWLALLPSPNLVSNSSFEIPLEIPTPRGAPARWPWPEYTMDCARIITQGSGERRMTFDKSISLKHDLH